MASSVTSLFSHRLRKQAAKPLLLQWDSTRAELRITLETDVPCEQWRQVSEIEKLPPGHSVRWRVWLKAGLPQGPLLFLTFTAGYAPASSGPGRIESRRPHLELVTFCGETISLEP